MDENICCKTCSCSAAMLVHRCKAKSILMLIDQIEIELNQETAQKARGSCITLIYAVKHLFTETKEE